MNIETAIAELELPFNLSPTDLVRLGGAYNGLEAEADAVFLSDGIHFDGRFFPVEFIEQLWNV